MKKIAGVITQLIRNEKLGANKTTVFQMTMSAMVAFVTNHNPIIVSTFTLSNS